MVYPILLKNRSLFPRLRDNCSFWPARKISLNQIFWLSRFVRICPQLASVAQPVLPENLLRSQFSAPESPLRRVPELKVCGNFSSLTPGCPRGHKLPRSRVISRKLESPRGPFFVGPFYSTLPNVANFLGRRGQLLPSLS